MGVTEETLNNIASVLKYPVQFFYQDELRTPVSNFYFRKKSTIHPKYFNVILSEIKIILKSIDYLLEEIDITEYPRYKFDLTEGWTPESVAIRIREILRIPSGPIKHPVKIFFWN